MILKTNMNNGIFEERLKEVTKGAGTFFMGAILGRGLIYISKVYIGRELGPNEFGLFNIGFAILMFITVAALLGLQEGAPAFISRFRVLDEWGKVKGVILSSFKIALFSCLLFSALVFTLSKFVSHQVFHEERLIPVIKTFAIIIPFFGLTLMLLSYLRGLKLIKQMVYSRNVFGNLSLILTLIVFFLLGHKLYGAIFAHLIQYSVIILVAVFYLRKNHILPQGELKPVPVTKELMRFSLPLTGAGSLERLRVWTDTFLIGFLLNSIDVGLFNSALIICQLLVVFSASFIVILLPINSELYAQNNTKEMSRIYYTVCKWLFFILVPIFFLLFFFPQSIIAIIFGAEYEGVGNALRILVCGYFFNATVGIWITIIYAIGKTKIDLYLRIAGITLNIVLSLILIPRLGIMGAAISHTISLILIDSLGVTMVFRSIRMWPFSLKFLRYFALSLIFFLVFYFFAKNNTFIRSSNIFLLGSFLIYFVVNSFAVLKLIRLDKEDKMIIEIFRKKYLAKTQKS